MSQFGNGWGNGPPGWGPPQGGYGPPPQGGYGPPPQPGYGPPPQPGYGPPPGYGPSYGAPGYGLAPAQPFGAPMTSGFVCRFCGYQGMAMVTRKISTGGIVVAVVLFFVFFPLFWIGLLMKETVHSCPQCRNRAF
jgi:hypothetical protein